MRVCVWGCGCGGMKLSGRERRAGPAAGSAVCPTCRRCGGLAAPLLPRIGAAAASGALHARCSLQRRGPAPVGGRGAGEWWAGPADTTAPAAPAAHTCLEDEGRLLMACRRRGLPGCAPPDRQTHMHAQCKHTHTSAHLCSESVDRGTRYASGRRRRCAATLCGRGGASRAAPRQVCTIAAPIVSTLLASTAHPMTHTHAHTHTTCCARSPSLCLLRPPCTRAPLLAPGAATPGRPPGRSGGLTGSPEPLPPHQAPAGCPPARRGRPGRGSAERHRGSAAGRRGATGLPGPRRPAAVLCSNACHHPAGRQAPQTGARHPPR